MERPKLPTAVLALFGIDMPDMIPLGLSFLPFLVEPRDVGLVPQVIPNLFHGYLVVRQALPCKLWEDQFAMNQPEQLPDAPPREKRL